MEHFSFIFGDRPLRRSAQGSIRYWYNGSLAPNNFRPAVRFRSYSSRRKQVVAQPIHVCGHVGAQSVVRHQRVHFALGSTAHAARHVELGGAAATRRQHEVLQGRQCRRVGVNPRLELHCVRVAIVKGSARCFALRSRI